MKKKLVVAGAVIVALAIIVIIIISAYRSSETYRKKQASITSIQNDQVASMKDYRQNADGTWDCEGYTYKYKLEISGRMHNAACDTTFVYLSNIENITFDQAWKAAGLSSNLDDYFDVRDAVLVAMLNEE